MRFCRTFALLTALISMTLIAALPATASRTAYRYDTAQRVINACVLGMPWQTVDDHPNPYMIEGMRRSDLKPDDWVFENPLAPATVVEGDGPADFVVKGKRDYWYVQLTPETASQLVGMDLIYISDYDLNLDTGLDPNDPDDRRAYERMFDGLQRAAEAGALVWIDEDVVGAAGGYPHPTTEFPWRFGFDHQSFDDNNVFALLARDPDHELLRDPHPLTARSVALLGDLPDRDNYDEYGVHDELGRFEDEEPQSTLTEGHYLFNVDPQFRTVVENVHYQPDGDDLWQVADYLPWAVAADHGSGTVLITAGGVGRDVVEWIFEREAGGTTFRPSPNVLQAPDVKFALNAIQWNDRWQQARQAPRASASSVARAPFPLDIAWQFPARTDDPTETGAPVPRAIGAVVSTPVYGRSIVYALSAPSEDLGIPSYLMAFDMRPREDRMGDSQFDDGVADFSLGAPYDMLWYVDLPADMTPHYSSPTLSSHPDFPQVVLVSYVDTDTGIGWVDCYNGSLDHWNDPTTPTGSLLWRRQVEPYSPTAEVVALSTPIVHNDYIYVLASEYDPAVSGDNSPNSTYGRAHCFELDYAWDPGEPWPDDASWWVYPTASDNIDGIGSPTAPETQRLLPPFHDPAWLAETPDLYPAPAGRTALPPAPGAMPVVHGAGGTVDGRAVDALLTFGTSVSYRWNGTEVRNDGNVGGAQYTLVPAPYRASTNVYGLNQYYFALRLNEAIDPTALDPVVTLAGTAPDFFVDQFVWEDDERYIYVSPASAREAAINAPHGDPLEAQLGVDVNVAYNALPRPEPHRLAGPVRWKRSLAPGQRISQPSAMGADEIAVTAGRSIDYRYLTPPPPPPPATSGVEKLDASTGATRWSYDPSRGMPGRTDAALGSNTTGAAFDDETVIVGASAVDYGAAGFDDAVVSSIIGLRRQIDMQVNLALGEAGQYPAAVHLLHPDGEIIELARSTYNVDPWAGRLTFPADGAANVVDADGYPRGLSMYGQAIRVEWPEDQFEDHVLPHIERFHHTPGFIRLHHRPVVDGSVTIQRPDGTTVNGAVWVNDAVDFGAPGTIQSARLDGWIDLRASTARPGDELLVSYRGWSEATGDWMTIPNPGDNIPRERHQAPVEFGPSLSSPAVAGDTIHVGTQGRDTNLNAGFDPGEPRKTFLSLMWDRATGYVRSGRTEPARRQPGVGGIPIVSGSPSITEDRLFVGSRMMGTPADNDVRHGYVSALAPWRVLLADSNRIVETTGSEPSWVCTGTSSPQATQDFIRTGEDLQRPFSRPAKATRLQTGNYLVVDSGNHRVVEVDRAGRMVWPLDLHGYELYTSPNNRNLKLSRPADAHRYYDVVDGYPVWHTVVADTGNARVIDIQTTFHHPDTGVLDGRQRHEVRVLTPAYVRGGERGAQRVRYTSATPIRDPRNDVVVGFLCAASNLNQLLVVTNSEQNRLVNPFAGIRVDTDGATPDSTWRHWAWLYDPDPTDGENVSNQPLQFENIKSVDVRRMGDFIHVAVTCGRYIGRHGEAVHPLAQEGAGVFEFRIDVSSPNAADWELLEFAAGRESEEPDWYFVGYDYRRDDGGNRRAMTTIATEAGEFDKRWYPVSSQRISPDTVLITNSLSQIENATHEIIGDTARDAVLGSHIFEVRTEGGIHYLDPDRSIPAPGEMWTDPFTQPAHAEISR